MTPDRLLATAERVAVPVWAVTLTAFLVAPLRRAGYPLGHDLVFTPRQPLDAATLGVSSAPPRAVPVDTLVALAERLVDGAVIGRLALVLPLLFAGLGAARLLAGAPLAARLVACGFAIWNPYVVERLAIGQWSLLWGYAALPWILVALRAPRRSVLPSRRLVLALAAGSVTATGGLLAVLVVVAASLRRGDGPHPRRAAALAIGAAVVLQLPWLVAGALSGASSTGDPAAVAAFAARGEFGGAVLSLLGLGGIWDAGSVPPSRETALALATVVVLSVAAVLGARTLSIRLGAVAKPLVACAAVGFALAVAAVVPGPDAVLRWLVTDLPGGGLLRDAQKWLAPAALLAAVLLGCAVERVSASWRRTRSGVLVAAALAVPLALLPDATRVVWPTLTPVHYPAGYATVDRLARGHGDVAVLPFQPYRRYSWADGRISFGPVPRLLSAGTVSGDRLQVGTSLLAGEDPRAARVADALAAGPGTPAALARAGIGWVLVERRTPGTVPSLDGLRRVHADADVALYRVPDPVREVGAPTWEVVLALGAHAVWLALGLGALLTGLCGLRSARRKLRARTEPAQDLQGQPD